MPQKATKIELTPANSARNARPRRHGPHAAFSSIADRPSPVSRSNRRPYFYSSSGSTIRPNLDHRDADALSADKLDDMHEQRVEVGSDRHSSVPSISPSSVPFVLRTGYRLLRMSRRLRHPVTLGVRLLLVEDGEILLVKHTYRAGWSLPGRPDETPRRRRA